MDPESVLALAREHATAEVLGDGNMAGERLYCDEGFFGHLLGPLFDLCTPIVA